MFVVFSYAAMIKSGETVSKIISLTQTQRETIEYLRKILSNVLDDRLIAISNNKNSNSHDYHPAFRTLLLCLIKDGK